MDLEGSSPSLPTTPSRWILKDLHRSLGLFDLTCIVIGAIIGVGIFFTPAKVVDITGSSSVAVAAWVLAGLIALTGSLTFAELGALFYGLSSPSWAPDGRYL